MTFPLLVYYPATNTTCVVRSPTQLEGRQYIILIRSEDIK